MECASGRLPRIPNERARTRTAAVVVAAPRTTVVVVVVVLGPHLPPPKPRHIPPGTVEQKRTYTICTRACVYARVYNIKWRGVTSSPPSLPPRLGRVGARYASPLGNNNNHNARAADTKIRLLRRRYCQRF